MEEKETKDIRMHGEQKGQEYAYQKREKQREEGQEFSSRKKRRSNNTYR